jgi:hypothetical protein
MSIATTGMEPMKKVHRCSYRANIKEYFKNEHSSGLESCSLPISGWESHLNMGLIPLCLYFVQDICIMSIKDKEL